jgi:hypothetical protein
MRFEISSAVSAVALILWSSVVVAGTVRLDGPALVEAEAQARTALASLAEGTPTFDATQAFTVTEVETRRQVLPARYVPKPPVPLANVDHCALVILQPDRPAQVVRTVGSGYTESLGCTGFDAIAFTDLDGDGRIEIAVIQSTLAPPDRYLRTPVVVHYRAGETFAVDETLSAALDEQGGITTIAALRRAVAKRRGTGSRPRRRP